MARPDSWMPMYWRDFWADTGHLSPAEGWAYLNLIGAYWMNGGPLEADEERLQRLAKINSLSEWERVRKAVLAFFKLTVIGNSHCYCQDRIDRELAKATKAYKSRVDHMEKVNARRKSKQSPSTMTATVTETVTASEPQSLSTVTATQPQPHSPNGETDANASVARPTSKPRRTRLASDWQPTPESYQFARNAGLDHSEIAADLSDFIAYWTGPEPAPAKAVKSDWERTYCNHIRDYAHKIIARRPRGQQSARNRPGSGSVVDVVARLKARADLGGQNDGVWMGGAGDELRPAEQFDAGNSGESTGDGGPVIDADDAERMYRAARGAEVAGSTGEHDRADDGSAVDAVPAETGGISGGRGAEGPHDASEHQPVLAVVVGDQGEAGPVQRAPAPASRRVDERPPLPDFLARQSAVR